MNAIQILTSPDLQYFTNFVQSLVKQPNVDPQWLEMQTLLTQRLLPAKANYDKGLAAANAEHAQAVARLADTTAERERVRGQLLELDNAMLRDQEAIKAAEAAQVMVSVGANALVSGSVTVEDVARVSAAMEHVLSFRSK